MAMPSNRIVGDPSSVVTRLEHLVAETGADELMVSTVAHGLDERIRSLELLASAWGVAAPVSTVISRSPSDRSTRPSITKNQS